MTRFELFALPLFLIASTLLLSGAENYSGPGFSFDPPASWSLTSSGDEAAGKIVLIAPGAQATVAWYRDPGILPERYLDQILRAYSSGEVAVTSAERAKIPVQGQKAESLDLSYRYKEYGSRKRFAVWISNRSDRLFLASFSGLREDAALLDRLLQSFSDSSDRLARLEPRGNSNRGDAWEVVLGDLLSSYHYKDQRTISPRTIYVEVNHALKPADQGYELSSEDAVQVDQPKELLFRAAVVQELLLQAGYESRVVQKGGHVWLSVADPAGKWQAVSLNPSAQERMVGVPINETGSGVVYRDARELAEDNGWRIESTVRLADQVQRDCDPSRYVELRAPSLENRSWIKDLQDLLDRYGYPELYQENVFDCSNTSQICWSLLKGSGYDARLIFSTKEHPLGPHMWVVVRYPYEVDGYLAVEATNTDRNQTMHSLGRVLVRKEYYKGVMYNSSLQFSRLHPEEGMWLLPWTSSSLP